MTEDERVRTAAQEGDSGGEEEEEEDGKLEQKGEKKERRENARGGNEEGGCFASVIPGGILACSLVPASRADLPLSFSFTLPASSSFLSRLS